MGNNRYNLTAPLELDPAKTYKVLVRTTKIGLSQPHVYEASVVKDSPTKIGIDPIPAGSPPPQVGDLLVVGESEAVTIDCQVKSIRPADDYSASLELVQYDERIFESESSGTLTPYRPLISPDIVSLQATNDVNLVVALSRAMCSGQNVSIPVRLTWTAPTVGTVTSFTVERSWDGGVTWETLATTQAHEYQTTLVFPPDGWDAVAHVHYRVSTGGTGVPRSVAAVYPYATVAHVAATHLQGRIADGYVYLTWQVSQACFNAQADIRFSPTQVPFENASIVSELGSGQTSVRVPLQNGYYYLKLSDPWGTYQADTLSYEVNVDNPFGEVFRFEENAALWGGVKENFEVDTLSDGSNVLELIQRSISDLSIGKYFFSSGGGELDLGAEFRNVQVEITLTAVNNQELVLSSYLNLNEIQALSQSTIPAPGLYGWGGHIVTSLQSIASQSVVVSETTLGELALYKTVQARYIRPTLVAWSRRFGIKPYFTQARFVVRMRRYEQRHTTTGNQSLSVDVVWQHPYYQVTQEDIRVQAVTQGVTTQVSNVTRTGCRVTLSAVSDFTVVANGYGEPA